MDDAIKQFRKGQQANPGGLDLRFTELKAWLSLGDVSHAQAIYEQLEQSQSGHYYTIAGKAWLNVYQGQFAAANELAASLTNGFTTPFTLWQAGRIYFYSGNYERASEMFFRVEPRFMDRDQRLDIHNGGNLQGCVIGLTLMQTGDEELGQDLLRCTINYMEEVLPRHIERADRWSAWECYYYLGEIEKALDGLEREVTHKTALWEWLFQENRPDFQQLREQPRFQDLDQKVRAELARQRENLAQMDLEAGK